jgi:hypothetical protein
MRRSWITRLLSTLGALCVVTNLSSPVPLHACAAGHGVMPAGAHGQSVDAPTAHAHHHDAPDAPTPAPQAECECVGACTVAGGLPTSSLPTVAIATVVVDPNTASFQRHARLVAGQPDLSLPFSVGPPVV